MMYSLEDMAYELGHAHYTGVKVLLDEDIPPSDLLWEIAHDFAVREEDVGTLVDKVMQIHRLPFVLVDEGRTWAILSIGKRTIAWTGKDPATGDIGSWVHPLDTDHPYPLNAFMGDQLEVADTVKNAAIPCMLKAQRALESWLDKAAEKERTPEPDRP